MGSTMHHRMSRRVQSVYILSETRCFGMREHRSCRKVRLIVHVICRVAPQRLHGPRRQAWNPRTGLLCCRCGEAVSQG